MKQPSPKYQWFWIGFLMGMWLHWLGGCDFDHRGPEVMLGIMGSMLLGGMFFMFANLLEP